MKKIHNAVLGAAVASVVCASGDVFAHAGVYQSHTPWDSASNTSTGLANSGFLEGTSPIVGVTISHTCAHEAPYPNLTGVGIVLPIGQDTLLLDGGKVTYYGAAANAAKDNKLPGNLSAIEDLKVGSAADPSADNAWNYTLTGYPTGVKAGSGTDGGTAPKAFANPEFKFAPEAAKKSLLYTQVTPFVNHAKTYDSQPYAYLWTGGNMPNERYVAVEIKPTLPKFPSKAAPAGTPGRCATQMKLYVPTMQICGTAKKDQHKVMNWQMAPTPNWDTSNMGETTFLNTPVITVNRDLAKNPVADDCPTAAALATTGAPSAYDPATAQTLFVYPSTSAFDAAFTNMANKARVKPTQAADKVHGCRTGETWMTHDGTTYHCMKM
jgi:hypothetical protein